MGKKIGALAAVAFVLSTQGVTAASISETRLQELMASTSMQEVSLETLRARDREILEELARSLALRYSDVLAGSEMVFTRLSESGSLFYRLDFVGLKNRDRARALCEVLEMDRCIAKIGNDRLTVLDVQTDPIVSAIAIVEDDADSAPFDWIEEDPVQVENPRAREIEAHVRDMLDPLRVYPEPRPDFSHLSKAQDNQAPASAPEVSKAAPSQDENPPQTEAEEVSSSAIGIFPLARPFHDVAEFESHPTPLMRPSARIAEMMAPAKLPVRVALFPLARPFGPEIAQAKTDVAPSIEQEPTVLTALAPIPSPKSAPISSTPAAPLGSFMGGYIEVADVGVMPVTTVPERPVMDAVIRIPGIGEVDLSKINAVTPQMEVARAVLPGISPSKAKNSTAMSRVMPKSAPALPVVQAATVAPVPTPNPFAREVAFADLEERQLAEAETQALTAGALAPHPMARDMALMAIAPVPSAMTSVAALSVSSPTVELAIDLPVADEAPERLAEVAPLTASSGAVDVAMAAPENPAQPVRMLAEVEPDPAPAPVPRRIHIETPAPERVAEAAPAPARPAPVAPEASEDKRSTMAALAVAQASTRASRLGSVSFDDRYARPASVDFNEGRVAGRLQKLPFNRPDLTGYTQAHNRTATPLREPGAPDGVAMLADRSAPFEIAQVPGAMAPVAEDAPDANQPFVMKEEPKNDQAPGDLLDRLLAGETKADTVTDAPSDGLSDFVMQSNGAPTERPAATDINAILGLEAPQNSAPAAAQTPLRPTVSAPAAAKVAPKAPVKSEVAQPPLQLTQEMRRPDPVRVEAAVTKPTVAPRVTSSAPSVQAPVPSQAEPDASVTFEAPQSARAAYEARQVEDDAAKQRRALEALSQIVQERQASEAAAPAVRRAQYPQNQESMQRRPAPRGPSFGNRDMAAAQEIAGYEASFSDDRTRMERAANPRGSVSPAERMQRHNSLAQAAAPSDLRIELSYVGSREQVQSRVAELKSFFPPVMMTKGRFFGASVPGQSNRFVVGFAATDLSTRDDIIWYLEQMGLPWAVR